MDLPLELLDRVDVVLDDRGDQGLVEAVGGGHHDVQLRARDRQRAAPAERVQQVERFRPFSLLGLFVETAAGRLLQQARLRLLGPAL